MTYEVAFKKLKEKFANVDVSVLEDMAIQITLSDEDCGGTFYAEVKNHVLSVEPYDYNDNDAVLDVTRKALTSILDGKLKIEAAIEKGDLSIKGDLEKVAKIKDAIKVPEKKTATKKATTAKTAKKAVETKTAKKETVKAEAKPAEKKAAEPKKAEPAKKSATKATKTSAKAAKTTKK